MPISDARRNEDAAPYFPASGDANAVSYFTTSSIARMTPADFEFPGAGDAVGLVNALTTHWRSEGETALANAGPRFEAIVAALRTESVQNDGHVDIFCYTLF